MERKIEITHTKALVRCSQVEDNEWPKVPITYGYFYG
jgi:hypothetical protein